jgi:hypothetical protein
MTLRRLSVVCFLALLLAHRVASAAGGDDSRAIEAAKKAFDTGMDQFRNGDSEGARILFAQSYAAYPSVETLRDLAIAELNSDHPLEALGHFKQYAKDRSSDAEFVKSRLPAFLARCSERVGHLRLAAAADVVVSVDGRRVLDTTDVLDVPPGDHAVEARRGASVNTQTVRAAAGQTVDVPLPAWTTPALPQGPTGRPSTAPLGEEKGADTGSTTWWTTSHGIAVALGGLAVVGVGVGLGSTLAATSNDNRASAIRASLTAGGPCAQCGDLNDKIAAAHRDSTVATVSFVLAGAAAASAGILALIGPTTAVRTGSIRWVPALGPGTAGLVGSF